MRAPTLIAFVVGVCSVQQLSALPGSAVFLGLLAGVLFLVRFRYYLLAAFLAGSIWAVACAQPRLADRLPSELERTDLVVEGVVASIPEVDPIETRFMFDVEAVAGPVAARVPRHLRLSWYRGAVQLKAGERWRLAVRLKRPHGMMNPGGMDYELWLFARDVGATGYVRASVDNARIAGTTAGSGLLSWRQSLYDRLSMVLGPGEFAGMHRALVMGDETGITPAQWQVLRRTGTAHLVAISGSHIALIAGWCFVLVRWGCSAIGLVRWPPPSVAAVCGFAAALGYSALADFAIPTQRALVMIAIVMMGILFQRTLRTMHTLALACFAVVLHDPLAVTSAGFWLSFAAVALIFLSLAYRLAPAGHAESLWRTNWATAIGLAPLLLLFFRQIPLVSPVANLLAVPLIGFIVIPLDLLNSVVMLVHPASAAWLFSVCDRLLSGVWTVLALLAQLPAAQWSQPQPPIWALIFAFSGVLWLLMPRGIPARWLGWVLVLPALSWRPEPPSRGEFDLSLLDVGQGLSVVVKTRNHTLVFDTGARFSDHFDMGSAAVLPFLTETAASRIDTLVISHGDNDHIGGAESLFGALPVELAYSSVPGLLMPHPALPCREGLHWQRDGVGFEFLSPDGRIGNDNDSSCVLRISTFGYSALLTGDIERVAEQRLVRRYGKKLRSEILVVPHHGSNTSSTPEFLACVTPRYALIPAGYLNRYGFPLAAVVQRLREIPAVVLNTSSTGAITIRVDARGIAEPVAFRPLRRRYWNGES